MALVQKKIVMGDLTVASVRGGGGYQGVVWHFASHPFTIYATRIYRGRGSEKAALADAHAWAMKKAMKKAN